jgi:hypothetical protein
MEENNYRLQAMCLRNSTLGVAPESMELFIEDQISCGRMIRLLTRPLPPSPVSNLFSFSVGIRVACHAY